MVKAASVFLNLATVGGTTLNDGSFKLSNIKSGQYELTISVVGYETYYKTILINSDIDLADIDIIPKVISLKEVNKT